MSKASSSGKAGKKMPAHPAAAAPPVSGTPQGFLENPFIHLLLLAIVSLVAYANTFHAPFVFDDNSSIVDNPVIKDLSTFLSGPGYAYNQRRFIGYLSFALNYRFGGLDTTGYHLVNLAVHIINGWLVYCFLRLTLQTPFFGNLDPEIGNGVPGSPIQNSKFKIQNSVPLLTALLFVAHPVQTQAVTYVVQRLASLATLFYLLSLVLYIRARLLQEETARLISPGTVLLCILSLASAILAMRTKEIAATLPLVVMLYEFSFFRAGLRKRLLFLSPLLLTVLIVPLGMLHTGKPLGELLSDVNEMTRQSQVISRSDYLLTQFSVIVMYLRLIFFPVRQNLDYDYPIYDSLFTPRVFISFLFLLALLGLALYLYRRSGKTFAPRSPVTGPQSRLISFGILWFFITLSVESSVIPMSDVIFEHRLYLPSVGAFIALAAGTTLLFRRCSARIFAMALTGVVLLLTAATWQRNLTWRDNLTIWGDAAAKSPNKYRPHDNLGNSLYHAALKARSGSDETHNAPPFADERKALLEKAVEQYREALRLKPDHMDTSLNLGAAYEEQGKTGEAFALYQKVLAINPRHAAAHNNMGALYSKEGLTNKAAEEFLVAIRLNPDFADAYVNLGETYLKEGQPDKAVELLQAALERNPRNARTYYNLGVVADLKGNFDEAIKRYEMALKLNPAFPEVANNLGTDYGGKGMIDQAIVQFQAAIRLKPDDADFHFNLAKAFELKGWSKKAAEEIQVANTLKKEKK